MKNRQNSIKFKGKPASKGVGIGSVHLLEYQSSSVRPEKIGETDVDGNLEKFRNAGELLAREYSDLKHQAQTREAQDILEAQIQTLQDPEVNKTIRHKIKNELLKAEYAIFTTYNDYIQLLEASDVEWAKERAMDVVSIRDELVNAVSDKKKRIDLKEGEIVFATDIPPATMVKISRIHVAGIVMEKGGATSHAVILSQSLGIPCVINVHWKRHQIKNGLPAIVDGLNGDVILNPTDEDEKRYQKISENDARNLEKALKWIHEPDQTKCGSHFTLRANVEFLEELPRLNEYGAKGIGLLRTETLLFEADEFDIDAQVNFYSNVLKEVANEPVIIRLFDAGGDKLLDDADEEANPFLGWRGIRMLLDEDTLLRKQLEAVYRVSEKYKGRLKILIPMVSKIEEIIKVNRICEEVKNKLQDEGVGYDESIEVGIMVEVPAIALLADRAAAHTDFFSIGTNDLTQYTLAVDRGNEKISGLFDSFHPAVWKMIKMTKEAADRHHIPLSVCGEMASKPEAAALLMGLGISDLSMNAGAIPYVKALLCSHNLKEFEALTEQFLSETDEQKREELLKKWKSSEMDS